MTASQPALRILIVGSGRAAGLHSRLLVKHHPNVSLMFCGRSAGPAQALAARYRGEVVSGDWTVAVADERADAVFITTPPDTHCDIAVAALDAGRHVIVEKPAFIDSGEFDAVEAAAVRHDRQVLVAENYLYKPLLRGHSRPHPLRRARTGAFRRDRCGEAPGCRWLACRSGPRWWRCANGEWHPLVRLHGCPRPLDPPCRGVLSGCPGGI